MGSKSTFFEKHTLEFIPKYDVSIILTAHNEARYLNRTIKSLEDAVRFARLFDITCEIIVVLDNADDPTKKLIEKYDFGVFDGNRHLYTNNGAPGKSRNSGISASKGDYITTLDADDLIAFDFIQKLYMTARSVGRRFIVFPEYCFGFGRMCYVYKINGPEIVKNASIFEMHPYVARIMFPRELFEVVQNADISTKNGYAHEDWHFNSQCLAAGYSVAIAHDATFFYRERDGSMRRRFDSETSGLIPKSRFFEPNTFLKLTWANFAGDQSQAVAPPTFTVADFMHRPAMNDRVHAINQIEPMVSMGILKYQTAFTNFWSPGPASRAYFEACRLVNGINFTDALIVPFFIKGGAEKYLLYVMDAIHQLEPEARLLVISTQPFNGHEWLERFPQGTVFIDLYDLGVSGIDGDVAEKLTLRLLQHVPGLKRVHIKNCEFVDSFARRYIRFLNHLDVTYYHFSDPQVEVNGLKYINGQGFDLVCEISRYITRVISDNANAISVLVEAIGVDHLPKLEVLYNLCEVPNTDVNAHLTPRKRLFWASRISQEKRPELVSQIAQAFFDKGMDIEIDVYGTLSSYGNSSLAVFSEVANLNYCGAFDGFFSIPLDKYDALIYTSSYDGLPNIVLEALASGLPVIAPDVGGIGEAVTEDTGLLVSNDADESELVQKYVEAIEILYEDWDRSVQLGRNGRALILERHAFDAYIERVRGIFDLNQSCESSPMLLGLEA